MCLYIFYAQLMVFFKTECGHLDHKDPFIKLIMRSKEDFLGNNNFVLICFTSQFLNILQVIFMGV